MLKQFSFFLALSCLVPVSLFASGDTVRVWMTTSNDSAIIAGLAPQADAVFGPDSPAAAPVLPAIRVDADTQYQEWEGAGASFTDAAAWCVNRVLLAGLRDSVMRALFDPAKGIGMSFLRNPMGSSDLTVERYTYDNDSTDINDTTLPHFSISHDTLDVLPLTKWARALNPELTLMMNAWSPPAWMKTNNSMIAGGVRPVCYPHLARYYVKTIEAYEAQGVHVNYVSLNNEPACCPGIDYSSVVDITAADMQSMLRFHWIPQFAEYKLSTKILLHDFNWYDIITTEPMLSDTVITRSPHVGGVAFHGYFGDPATQTRIHNQYGLNIFQTERSSIAGTPTRAQHRRNFQDMAVMLRNWSRSYVKWPVATNENWGPHLGGCDKCMGMIKVYTAGVRSGQFDYTIDYYTIGHLTKFVRNKAKRIFSTNDSTVLNVAFLNPDKSIAVVAYNNDSLASRKFKVLWGSKSFTYTIPAAASMTFAWDGTTMAARNPGVKAIAQGMPHIMLIGNILIVTPKMRGKISAEVFTTSGRRVRFAGNDGGAIRLRLDGLSTGIYHVKVNSEFGSCWKKVFVMGD